MLVSWGGLPANPQAYEPLGSTHSAPTYQLGVVSRRPRRTRPQQGRARSRRRKRGASPPPGKSRTGPAGRRALWPSPPEGGRGFEWASSGREWASSGREWARVGERGTSDIGFTSHACPLVALNRSKGCALVILRTRFGCSTAILRMLYGCTHARGRYHALRRPQLQDSVCTHGQHQQAAGRQVLGGVCWRVWMLWGCAARGTCVQGAKIAHLDGASA